ncbi:MAG TPA: hypothetical protein VF585_07760 [Chthoniobacterales bacterium]|jgi:cytochrome c oxidase subunit 2
MFLALINELLGLPPAASEHAPLIDNMLEMAHWLMVTLFVGWFTFFVYVLFRFHKSRNPKASYHGVKTKLSTHIEVSVVLVEAVLLLGFALPIWSARVNEFPKSGATMVRVYGEQFAWNFWYPGVDGVFGRRDLRLITASNPLGLDKSDPSALDDAQVKNSMQVPIDKPVIVEISSKDVIHNFALHEMRIAHDALPGSLIPMWFTPNKLGDYEIICAQLCGSGHYSMKGMFTVAPQEEYDTWIKSFVPKLPATAQADASANAPASAATPATL